MGNIKINKNIFLIIAAILFVVATIAVYSMLNSLRAPSGVLEVDSKVKNSQFIFNNQTYYTPAVIKNIPLGSYTLYSHNNGYEDESRKITFSGSKKIKVNLKTQKLTIEDPVDTEEKKWVDAINKEADEGKKIIEQREVSNPLTKFLPVVIDSVMFDFEVNDNNSIVYVVYALPGKSYIRETLEPKIEEFILSKDINPNTLSIEWK